jgi:hypothetical protein
MRRRALLGAAVGVLASLLRAGAQHRVYRIGFLRIGSPPKSFIEPFRQGLSDLGYVEGQNLIIEPMLISSLPQGQRRFSPLATRPKGCPWFLWPE